MNVLLLDGTGLAYRSYYAFVRNPLRNTRGEETSLTFAFVNTLLRLLRRQAPERAAVVFDAPGRTFRHALDARYKEGRPPMPQSMVQQLPRLHETLAALRLSVLQVEGYEADDVMGTLARHFESRGALVYLVTADKDFLQLVSPRVHLLRFSRAGGDMQEIGPDELAADLGFGAEAVVDYMTLVGDSTDNVPGVPGIGDKTARTLIRTHRSLEQLFAHLEEFPPALRHKLESGRESALAARRLLRIVTDVPLELGDEALRWNGPDWPRLGSILRELEFSQLLRELPVYATGARAVGAPAPEVVSIPEQLEALVRAAGAAPAVALAAATEPDASGQDRLVGLALSWEPERVSVVPIATPPAQLSLGELGLVPRAAPGLEPARVQEALASLLAAPRCRKIGHDLKQLARLCDPVQAVLVEPLEDTMVASYVLNPARRSHALEDLAHELLGLELPRVQSHPAAAKRGSRRAPGAEWLGGLGNACTVVWRLVEPMRAQLEAEHLTRLYEEIEIPLLGVLLRMEQHGVQVDVAALEALSLEIETRSDSLAERIWALAGRRFNIQSTRQLGEILFEVLHLPHGRRTQSGWSTDVDVLEQLSRDHELPRLVLEFRQLVKLRSTYTEALPRLVQARSGRIHTRFNQTVAATGRLTSSAPNLQNIPIRSELGRRVRAAFVAASPAGRLLAADYSQIELRLVAHLSGDRALVEAFRSGGDVHTLTAARIAGCAPDAVTPEQRSTAKTVNFGVIYGMGARGLAQQLGIPLDEARHFIAEYFDSYPGVRRYTEEAVARARAQGYVTTLLGRKLLLPDLASPHPPARAFAERVAVNAPVQGSAADLIKTAMVRVERRLVERRLASRLILQVHDELVFEAPVLEVEELETLARAEMENAFQLSVPLVVEVGSGRDWAEAH